MKILITGGAGFLGKKLRKVLTEKFNHEIICTDRSGNNETACVKMDIADAEEVMNVISEHKPNAVIHCAAMSDVDDCEEHKKLAMTLNRDSTENVVNACNTNNALIVHISTDFVFDGKRGNYSEEDETNPLSYYAETKLAGELAVRNKAKKFIVVRPEVLYGFNGDGSERSFTMWVHKSLKDGKTIKIVDDQFNTPTLTDDIANAIGELINKDKTGVWHVAGSERLSRFDMAVTLAEVFGFDKELIERIDSSKLQQKAIRPMDSSLNIEKLNKEGITMHTFREGIKIMKLQIEETV